MATRKKNSKVYWQDRDAQEVHVFGEIKGIIKREQAVIAQEKKIYAAALDELDKELDALRKDVGDEAITRAAVQKPMTARDLEQWSKRQQERLDNLIDQYGDEEGRKIFGMENAKTGKQDRADRVVRRQEILKKSINAIANGAAAQTETVTQKALEAEAQNGATAFQNQLPPELKATAKVDFDTVDEGTVTRTAQTLFKPEDFSERIWANRDVLVKDLERSISLAVTNGWSIPRLAKEFEHNVAVDERSAERIARTEMNRVSNAAELAQYRQNNIKYYRFIATEDARTCEICGKLHDTVHATDAATPGENFPPVHPNCRCRTVISTVDENGNEDDSWLDDMQAEIDALQDEFDEMDMETDEDSEKVKEKSEYDSSLPWPFKSNQKIAETDAKIHIETFIPEKQPANRKPLTKQEKEKLAESLSLRYDPNHTNLSDLQINRVLCQNVQIKLDARCTKHPSGISKEEFIEDYRKLNETYLISSYESTFIEYLSILHKHHCPQETIDTIKKFYTTKKFSYMPPPAIIIKEDWDFNSEDANATSFIGGIVVSRNTSSHGGIEPAVIHELCHVADHFKRGIERNNPEAGNSIIKSFKKDIKRIESNGLSICGAPCKLDDFKRNKKDQFSKKAEQLINNLNNELVRKFIKDNEESHSNDYDLDYVNSMASVLVSEILDTLQSVFGYEYGSGHRKIYCANEGIGMIEAVANLQKFNELGIDFFGDSFKNVIKTLKKEF